MQASDTLLWSLSFLSFKVSVIMHGDSAVRRKKHIAVTILFAVSVFLIQHAHTDASRSFLHYRYPMSATTNTSLQTHPGQNSSVIIILQ